MYYCSDVIIRRLNKDRGTAKMGNDHEGKFQLLSILMMISVENIIHNPHDNMVNHDFSILNSKLNVLSQLLFVLLPL